MTDTSTPSNPVDLIEVTDLFEKDPDLLNRDERARIIAFYRDQRATFLAMEEVGGPKKAKAAAKKAAAQGEVNPLDIVAGTN